MFEHGILKFPNAGLILSSSARGWRGMAAEVRSHPKGEIPPFTPANMEVTLALKGDGKSKVGRRGGGTWQDTSVRPGTIWLCPIGVHEDSIRITEPIPEVLHLYIPSDQFGTFSSVEWDRPIFAEDIDYLAGLEDELVRQIGYSVLRELREESASGSVLLEALSLALVAHLCHTYSGVAIKRTKSLKPEGLDGHRLRRVIEYIDDNPGSELTITELASVACLSKFHFARAFQKAVGSPPHRYVSRRRLDLARRLLLETCEPLAQIALTCRFSSQANFTRAFRKATGFSPGEFRSRAPAPTTS